ncbi:MAG: hypothetical protein NTZ69_18115 [Bacteroidia bacterium]|nr:hypothetical protein [Bacteroidia bacterium]
MRSFIKFSSFLIVLQLNIGCAYMTNNTTVTIEEDRWFINEKIINKGSLAEGLLMNVRMVNSVFEDRGTKLGEYISDFNPQKNTDVFISKIPEYTASGVNGFTISLQGGSMGYEGAVNSAFEAGGTIRDEYMDRIAKVVNTCNENNAVVILSCFYQRQHSHFSALTGKKAIFNALENTVNWVKKNHFRNVLLEVSNEYRHGGYRNWADGEWLISEKGQIELIKRAKSLYPSLLVSTSGMGNGQLDDSLAKVVDYITIHFNNTSPDNYRKRIEVLKRYGKPVICDEDDKLKETGVNALVFSVLNGCGWGYMNTKQNQNVPFKFEGIKDDTAVYNMMKKVTTPGYFIDESGYKQSSIIITFPKDGDIFKVGQQIDLRFSHLFPDTTQKYIIQILSNNNQIGVITDNQARFNWQLKEPGIFIFEALVKDLEGKELLRSSKVDIIVQN